jgi:large subunit ribosomal protein L31e
MDEENEEKAKTPEEEREKTAETAEEAETEMVPEKEEEKETPEEAVEAETKEEHMPTPGEEEEAKPAPREKKEEEEEVVEERIYTIPLGKALIMPPRKRAPRAMRMLRSFIIKHMKLEAPKGEGEEEEEPKELSISNEVNERVWGRGVEKPPRKIRVRAAKDKDGNVTVYLAEGD